MENNFQEPNQSGQINPGQTDQAGNEVTIKKNESISDQGNEWSDEEEISSGSEKVLGEKAEKYIKDSGDIEDLPDEEDDEKARMEMSNKEKNASVTDDQKEEDEVIERMEDYVPGYDLGRNKVQ